MLRDMENAFRMMLPTQYHEHRALLGKPVKVAFDSITDDKKRQKEQLWDRYAFFHFIFNSRVCHNKNFVWMALVNAAADYGGQPSHIATHFGFATSQNTLLRRLNLLHPYSQIILQKVETLSKYKNFVVAVFDNSQVNIEKKFQRFGSCSNMAIATCRLFAEPTTRDYIDSIISPEDNVPILYLDQPVPSPYGMPKYKGNNERTADTFKYQFLLDFENSIDVTGARVNAYYHARRLLSTTRRCKRMIPYSMEKPYGFSNEEHNHSLLQLRIPSRLQPNYCLNTNLTSLQSIPALATPLVAQAILMFILSPLQFEKCFRNAAFSSLDW